MSRPDGARTRTFAPPLDPDLAAVVAAQPALRAPLMPEAIGRLRDWMAGPGRDALTGSGEVAVTEFTVPGGDGAALPVLLLPPAHGPVVALACYFHGGGLVVGDNRTGIAIPRHWAAAAGVAVASVGYRLGAQDPSPGAGPDR